MRATWLYSCQHAAGTHTYYIHHNLSCIYTCIIRVFISVSICVPVRVTRVDMTNLAKDVCVGVVVEGTNTEQYNTPADLALRPRFHELACDRIKRCESHHDSMTA